MSCDRLRRLLAHRALRRARPRAAACRRSSPACRCPAGTGLTRRSFLAALGRARARRLRRPALPQRRFEDGHRAARPPRTASRVLVSIFLDGGVDALSVLVPAGDPQYRALRPKLALAADPGTRVRRGRAAALAPGRWRRSPTLHAEGKVTVLPGGRLRPPDQSHFTSRHFWEVGATDTQLRTGWLGRFLDRVGTPDNPLQGLSLDDAPAAGARDREGAGRGDRRARRLRLRAAGRRGRPLEAPMLETVADARRRARAARPTRRSRRPRGAAPVAARCARSSQPFASATGSRSPVAYPVATTRSRRGWPGSRRCSPPGCRSACAALTRSGRLRHARRPGRRARPTELKLTSDSLLAFQRDLEARGLADRVLVARVVGVRPPRAGERLGGTDHGAAGIGFLIGTRAARADDRRVPGPRAASTSTATCAPTADFRGVYSALLEQWLDDDANAVIPDVAAFERPSLVR